MQRIYPLLLLYAWLTPSWADGGLEKLDRFYREVKRIHAHFDQVVQDEDRTIVDRAKGELWISRPGRFRWNYDPPDAQEIVGDSRKLWIHDVELEQVTVRDQAQALGRTPAILLAGSGNYKAGYTIADGGSARGVDWVVLRPKEEGGFVEVRIGFRGSSLATMELLDTLGQTTRITFHEVEINDAAASGQFAFVPPMGVDIIDETRE